MPFDVDAARKAGYSDDEILQHLTQSRSFDVNGAVQAGYSKQEIISHLSGSVAPSAPAPEPQAAPEEQTPPTFIDKLKSEAQAVYHHPAQAALGAAKAVPGLFQSMLPSAGVVGEVPGADASGKMKMPSVANAYNKAAGAVTQATTPQNDAQAGGSKLATAASLVAPTAGLIKAGVEAIPSAEKASKLFGDVAKEANNIPVQLENSHDAAIKLMDWQKKTQLGPTLNKFLNRITNPNLGQMTYQEGREWQQLISKMSAEESSRLAPAVKFQVQKLAAGLKSDIGNAAGQVGRAADYYQAMGDYHHAMQLREWYNAAKDAITSGFAKAAIKGAGLGAGGAAGYEIYRRVSQ